MTYDRKVGPSNAMQDYMDGKITPKQYVGRIRQSGNILVRKIASSNGTTSNQQSKKIAASDKE